MCLRLTPLPSQADNVPVEPRLYLKSQKLVEDSSPEAGLVRRYAQSVGVPMGVPIRILPFVGPCLPRSLPAPRSLAASFLVQGAGGT